MHTQLLIIGSGPAGYTAGIYAARADLKPVLFSGLEAGGQLMVTTDVENYPGFADVIQGPWLMEQMKNQAEHTGVKILSNKIVKVDFSQRPFICYTDENDQWTADSVIICTGAQARWLGIESEKKFRGYGVSACATCDGFFYKNHDVAIIGGGDTAAEEALFLTKFARSVTLIHRRDRLRADKVLQKRLFDHPKITIEWNQEVDCFLGTQDPLSLTGIRLKNTQTGEKKEIKVTGAFVAIGYDPSTRIFQNKVDLDEDGYIITQADSTKTNIKGVFAAGDVMDKIFRQAVTAAGAGCMAALEAEKYLSGFDEQN